MSYSNKSLENVVIQFSLNIQYTKYITGL